ncbi:hypothetical protein [Jiangella alkaliphila]|uniref:Uncharacterized protein n=1 Tax=Jiangella alkaliphila TaxID=419479 RepID=A0A1H2IFT5_9ACTN|nr:hypothetical protein [Jiangella alkaliphila]SDU42871.1 hypothetical protein SAMN04488563_1676 [Jiangella alkaliphila]
MPKVTDWRVPERAHRLTAAAEDHLDKFVDRLPGSWHRGVADAGQQAVDYIALLGEEIATWGADVAADLDEYNQRRPPNGRT